MLLIFNKNKLFHIVLLQLTWSRICWACLVSCSGDKIRPYILKTLNYKVRKLNFSRKSAFLYGILFRVAFRGNICSYFHEMLDKFRGKRSPFFLNMQNCLQKSLNNCAFFCKILKYRMFFKAKTSISWIFLTVFKSTFLGNNIRAFRIRHFENTRANVSS
jgi:hypothetical protein